MGSLVLVLQVLCIIVADFTSVQGYLVGTLPTLQHGVSGSLFIINSRRLYFERFSYDGQGPDAFLYYYSPGVDANNRGGGSNIPVPGGKSDGSFLLSRRYSSENVTIDLPSGMDACDIGILTIWCRRFTAFFTTITVPRDAFLNNGADPCVVKTSVTIPDIPDTSFDNCVVLAPFLLLSWTVKTNSSEIMFRLCGCRGLDLNVNRYMGFGLSGSNMSTNMIGADATITWVDNKDASVNAVDYHLNGRVQCRNGTGACPDVLISGGRCTNDVTNVTGGARNEEQCVSFTRNFSTSDTQCDLTFDPASEQYIVWAVGGYGQTAFIHFMRSGASTPPMRLGRTPSNDCGTTSVSCPRCAPFVGKKMYFKESTTISMQIGPAGGERGYTAITGQAGWGIAWYVNGELVPVLVLTRGQTYTFKVEGGTDPSVQANYHPFYITNSSEGGMLFNDPSMTKYEKVFAGIDANGKPTTVGRLCMKNETEAATKVRESCGKLDSYQDALTMKCEEGEPGVLTWTPDDSTPDVVYYQCATHLSLGWKIVFSSGNVLVQSVFLLPFCILTHFLWLQV